MTEEQIKQNAEKCARLVLMPFQAPTDESKGRYEGFIAGAHSRDEEIKKLKNAIDKLKRENGQLKIDKEYWRESAMEYINRDNEKY